MNEIVNYGNIGERICHGLDCENCIRSKCPFENEEQKIRDKVDAEVKEITDMWEVAQSIEPDMDGKKVTLELAGKFKKQYAYGTYRDIVVRTYENGALLINTSTGKRDWYKKSRQNLAFEKAKTLSARNSKLNWMMR